MPQVLDINGYHFLCDVLNYDVFESLKLARYTLECVPVTDKDVDFVRRWYQAMVLPELGVDEEFLSDKYGNTSSLPETVGIIEGFRPLQNLIIQAINYEGGNKIRKVTFMGGETLYEKDN